MDEVSDYNGYLDPSPIPPPLVRADPLGRPSDFFDIVIAAGMRNVISTHNPPDIRICDGSRDFKAVRPGQVVYCLGEANLPGSGIERNREILRRLAYGFHDWAARETVARYHRDLKRPKVEAQNTLADGKASLKILRFLRANPGATVGQITSATGIAQPNVSRTLSQWHGTGKVTIERQGRIARCFLEEPSETPAAAERDDVKRSRPPGM